MLNIKLKVHLIPRTTAEPASKQEYNQLRGNLQVDMNHATSHQQLTPEEIGFNVMGTKETSS